MSAQGVRGTDLGPKAPKRGWGRGQGPENFPRSFPGCRVGRKQPGCGREEPSHFLVPKAGSPLGCGARACLPASWPGQDPGPLRTCQYGGDATTTSPQPQELGTPTLPHPPGVSSVWLAAGRSPGRLGGPRTPQGTLGWQVIQAWLDPALGGLSGHTS